MMINFTEIWNSINNESKNDNSLAFAAREIQTDTNAKLFLASNIIQNKRLLFVLVENMPDNVSFPKIQGMDISINKTSLGFYKDKDFLCLKQIIEGVDNIFELVISDIANSIINMPIENNVVSTIINSLETWRLFFEKNKNKSLSIEKQKGLYGELTYLRDYVLKQIDYSKAIESWKGPDRAYHDFEFTKIAVEIKTTSGKEHKKFIISSEKQLDLLELDNLYLGLFSLNIHFNNIGQTLIDIIEECDNILAEFPAAKYAFNLKLLKSGFLYEHKSDYKTRFSISSIDFFEIIDDFPRIIKQNLPIGLGDIKYSVMVSACERYRIDNNQIKLD